MALAACRLGFFILLLILLFKRNELLLLLFLLLLQAVAKVELSMSKVRVTAMFAREKLGSDPSNATLKQLDSQLEVLRCDHKARFFFCTPLSFFFFLCHCLAFADCLGVAILWFLCAGSDLVNNTRWLVC